MVRKNAILFGMHRISYDSLLLFWFLVELRKIMTNLVKVIYEISHLGTRSVEVGMYSKCMSIRLIT